MNAIRKKFAWAAVSLLLALVLLAAAACVGQGDDPESSSEEPEDPAYVYGEDWADPYDARYTQDLLSMGESDFTLSQTAGRDGAGREVTTVGEKTGGRYVGIFYFLWLGDNWPGIYDISKLQEQYADLATDTVRSPLWANAGSDYYDASISPQNAFHYFEEPLYGYYHSDDPWVIRKHLELLAYAGIDFLYLDFTNAGWTGSAPINIYREETIALMDAILELQGKGLDVPQIVPMVCNPSTAGGTANITHIVEWVYETYYAAQNFKYADCWFTADEVRNPSGKPLLVCYDFDPQYLSNPEVADAFWIRNVVWPTAVGSNSYQNGFPWMDYSLPQANYNGIMNVSIAQHLGGSWSSEAYLARSRGADGSNYTYRGRSATAAQRYAYQSDSTEEAKYGANFANQWENVLNYEGEDEVWMVTVTGWNEWVAQKLNVNSQYATFVDTFNTAFSRDIEMMRDENGYADNYYMQLAANVRLFKYGQSGKTSNTAMWERRTVDYADMSAWEAVQAKYVDFTGDAVVRNYASVADVYTYTDNSARNDISYLKIANDSQYLYVLVAAAEDITAHEAGDTGWMNLYLSTGADGGWENYNFLINRHPEGSVTSIERLGVDGSGKITVESLSAKADYVLQGNMISFRIPLEALGVTSADEIQLKACDNVFANTATEDNDGVGVFEFGDVMAFYTGGDCAPMGRLNYAYRMAY